VEIYEQTAELKEIGAGINLQAVAVAVLADVGVSIEMLNDPASADGIKTTRVRYFTPEGVFIAEEATGLAAGSSHPQFSLHRAKFHQCLVDKCLEVLGSERIHLDAAFKELKATEDGVRATFLKKSTGEDMPPVECDMLVGADGLKSRVRAALLGDMMPRYTGRTIFRGICELDEPLDDGASVLLCGNHAGNFIAYNISEGKRAGGKALCNWGFNALRPLSDLGESWTNRSSVDDIREELARYDANCWGGLTPLQMAERSQNIIGWGLFDRDPLDSFDFGRVTLLGDAAHPLLPFGSQGATQAILDAEALGVALADALAAGQSVKEAVRAYSELRCKATGEVVISNRNMGPTRVLAIVDEKCEGFSAEEKEKWIMEKGRQELDDWVKSYRRSMPKTVRAVRAAA